MPTSRRATRVALTSAFLLAMLMIPTAPTVGAERAAAQVTQAEYKKVKAGMTKSKVKSIVGASGQVYSKGYECLIKKYTTPDSRTAFFAFYVGQLEYKKRLDTSVQGSPPQCAGPS